MVESNRVMADILDYFSAEIASQTFRVKISSLTRELGLFSGFSGLEPPKINAYLLRLNADLAQTATRQEQQRLSALSSAFSQLKDSARTHAKRDLVSGALSGFYSLSSISAQGNTGSFSHKELRSLAFLGLAAAYHELDDADELVAEKLALAIYEHPPTAAQFVDRSYAKPFGHIFATAGEDSQFILNGGIAKDVHNGLMWLRFALGQEWYHEQVQGRLERFEWKEAFAAAQAFNRQGGYEGYTDWRLPLVEELKTLIDFEAGDTRKGLHFINNRVFPGHYDLMWSASAGSYNNNVAWIVDFTSGSAFYGNINYGYGVRLVRKA
ncbi:Lcl C-terminal domain-containing protein [Methylovulum psychrotolerans]|jgi:hypothetical protein|uniref:Lcl C-terminal domain-containing protein n=1 Tax=Methylovulum psychrotolerans TaxID=1704499 RepID=A0A1Z4BUI1_9GAMM|nr:DUF1566 domain-containing protein [Methylovulum psychrotolerans]ASF44976.1 hypothetical protein CEK71_02230 [Methylovulum psychrotolerans]POZ53927.1 hypothetical protein AADEFJLK_00969 [Methylovulum psychrotolerans]